MTYRWLGAVLIVAGCGGFGISMAASCRRQERLLGQLIEALQYMQWELQYRLTPLPELCRTAAKESGGLVRTVLRGFSRELEKQMSPDTSGAMLAVLHRMEDLSRPERLLFRKLGSSLGRYDLPGQLEGLESLEKLCERQRKALEDNRDVRLRSYETLGFCAGAALVILFV